MSTRVIQVFGILSLVGTALGSAYIGCFELAALNGGGGVIYDDRYENCPDLIVPDIPYSNSWQYVENTDTYACRGWEVPLNPKYLVADRTCAYPNVNVTLTHPPTDWTWAGCWYLHPSSDWVQVANVSTCLANCETYPYAYSRYNSDLTISCLCAVSQPPYDLPLDCGYGDPFWYTHPYTPPSSEAVKRRKREKEQERLKRKAETEAADGILPDLCPSDMRACKIPGSSGLLYECIDTSEEIQSCGGCVEGDYSTRVISGQDCTAIEGAFTVGCQNGQCKVYSSNQELDASPVTTRSRIPLRRIHSFLILARPLQGHGKGCYHNNQRLPKMLNFVLVILALTHNVYAAEVFAGCFSPSVIDINHIFPRSYLTASTTCPEVCRRLSSVSNSHAYSRVSTVDPTTSLCWCTAVQPDPKYLIADSSCPHPNLSAELIRPPPNWGWYKCFDFLAQGPANPFPVQSLGLKACKISEGDNNSFECLDTDYELESCGGCLHREVNDGNLSNQYKKPGIK
ncbi:uncharacterized protein I303_103882 [Kwoniella dejecticola CBS 10117]|uniref:Protein CPL1-like domain-containing protein n=1 Tax=Kwoniella dejecticola CBS 10117 TaxID=1296121 RepID=A0A1A6A7Z8_9TREE|nr:uncharacterized protein I303_03901 [Kwoniella dejecticola CBS 10117]OBR86181.1 hypothetical protein I303_03901 [Kwoniella dejecticola CBS 10117]